MTEVVKKPVKDEAAPAASSPKKANPKAVVKCHNITKRVVNTSRGQIKAGENGECTAAELRQLHAFLGKGNKPKEETAK